MLEAIEDEEPAPKRRSRAPGLTAVVPEPKAVKRAKKPVQPVLKVDDEQEIASTTASSAPAENLTDVAKSDHSKSKRGSDVTLDPDLQQVKEKHMSTDGGSSVKALDGLTVEVFLNGETMGYTRTGLAAKLRGAAGICTISWTTISFFILR